MLMYYCIDIPQSGSVPCWMFLAWLGQLVALLDKNEATAVHGILETIANTYPRVSCLLHLNNCLFVCLYYSIVLAGSMLSSQDQYSNISV